MSYFGFRNPKVRDPIKKPTKFELSWASGFIEGEGCFCNSGTTQCITVSQSGSTETLKRLQEYFGGTVRAAAISGTATLAKSTLKKFEWRVYGDRARKTMKQLYPLMSTRKQKQIKKVYPDWSK